MTITNMIQKILFVSVLVSALFLTGCLDSSQCSGSSQCSTSDSALSTSANAQLSAPSFSYVYPGDTTASITWTINPYATSYDIYRAGTKLTSTSSVSFTDTNLTNGQTYIYCVVAVNATSQSPLSNCVSVTPKAQQVFNAGSMLREYTSIYFFDSANNLYSSLATGGILKTSPSGATNIFFSGKSAFLIAKDSADNVYALVDAVGDMPENGIDAAWISIQKISQAGVVSTFCNSSNCSSVPVIQGIFTGGGAVDSKGNLFIPIIVWDPTPNITGNTFAYTQIAKISASGAYSVFAGVAVPAGDSRCIDGNSTTATFSGITKMQTDSSDNIYIFDYGINGQVCNSIRKIASSGNVTTTYNFGTAVVSGPVWDNSGDLYFEQYVNNSATGTKIQLLSANGTLSTYCGGASFPAHATGNCSQVYFQQIVSNLEFDSSENLYFLTPSLDVNLASYPMVKVIPH